MMYVDPQRDRIWIYKGEGLERVWESTAYLPGGVMDRMARSVAITALMRSGAAPSRPCFRKLD